MPVAAAGWAAAAVAAIAALIAAASRARARERVARAAHELRGPLTAARLGLELAGRPGQRTSAILRSVDLQLARAALALDDLGAAHAHRNPGARVAQVELVELAGLVADCLTAHAGLAEARGVQLVTAPSGRSTAWVEGDRTRLAQALSNLIANAIEHGSGSTQQGRVEVAVREDGIAAVRIEVRDSGPGLPARVDDLVGRPRGGRGRRGRGLAIAAGIAAAHGGRLWAAPSAQGARLVLELPAAERRSRYAPAE